MKCIDSTGSKIELPNTAFLSAANSDWMYTWQARQLTPAVMSWFVFRWAGPSHFFNIKSDCWKSALFVHILITFTSKATNLVLSSVSVEEIDGLPDY